MGEATFARSFNLTDGTTRMLFLRAWFWDAYDFLEHRGVDMDRIVAQCWYESEIAPQPDYEFFLWMEHTLARCMDLYRARDHGYANDNFTTRVTCVDWCIFENDPGRDKVGAKWRFPCYIPDSWGMGGIFQDKSQNIYVGLNAEKIRREIRTGGRYPTREFELVDGTTHLVTLREWYWEAYDWLKEVKGIDLYEVVASSWFYAKQVGLDDAGLDTMLQSAITLSMRLFKQPEEGVANDNFRGDALVFTLDHSRSFEAIDRFS